MDLVAYIGKNYSKTEGRHVDLNFVLFKNTIDVIKNQIVHVYHILCSTHHNLVANRTETKIRPTI